MKKYIVVIVFAVCIMSAMMYALRPDLLGIETQAQKTAQVEKRQPVRGSSKRVHGRSGTAFSPAPGFFVTNHHVVEDCLSITGMRGRRRFTVEVVTVTEDQDLALLRTNDPDARFVGTVPISMQDTLVKGGLGYIAGFSGDVLGLKEASIQQTGLALPFAVKGANGRPAKKTLRAVAFLSSAYHGDSGAPLVDTAGRVVAVVSRGLARKEGRKETIGAAVELGKLRALLAPYATVYSVRDFNLPDALSRSARQRLLNATVQLRCRLE